MCSQVTFLAILAIMIPIAIAISFKLHTLQANINANYKFIHKSIHCKPTSMPIHPLNKSTHCKANINPLQLYKFETFLHH